MENVDTCWVTFRDPDGLAGHNVAEERGAQRGGVSQQRGQGAVVNLEEVNALYLTCKSWRKPYWQRPNVKILDIK